MEYLHMTYGFSVAKLRKMPLRTRIALGTALVDRVERLYSEYFRKTFHQDEAIKLLSRFAGGKAVSEKRIQQMERKLLAAIDRAEEEGYDFHEVWMSGSLIEELLRPDGKGIRGAIDAARMGFEDQVLYNLGLDPGDRRLGNKYVELIDALGEPVYEAAREGIELAKDLPESDVSVKSFASLSLPDPTDPSLIPDAIREIAKRRRSRRTLPPLHERKPE